MFVPMSPTLPSTRSETSVPTLVPFPLPFPTSVLVSLPDSTALSLPEPTALPEAMSPVSTDGATVIGFIDLRSRPFSTFVIDEVQKLGTFSETNWNHRSIVEIPLAKKSEGWFLHAMTGHEAYVKFVFRVPGRPFKQDQLAAKLALRPLSDTPGLEGYSRDDKRVEVGNWPGQQYIVVVVHKKAEIDTPAFREFLRRAVEVVRGTAATAAEVRDRVERHGRRLAWGARWKQRADEPDVVQIVPGLTRQRARMPPPCHPGDHQSRVSLQE